MSNIDKHAVQAVADLKAGYTLGHADVAILNELARIALASLEAEAVGEVVLGEYDDCGCHPDARVACIAADGQADWENFKDGTRLYTAPPAPVPVPAAMEMDDDFDSAFEHGKAVGWNACRAAMLQGKSEQPQNAQQNIPENIPGGNSPVTPDGWISCSDRMPNEEDVLVYCSDTKEQMVGFHKGKGLFQFFYMNGVEGVCEPSHWMPLPEPPL
ncbi:TPA: DUF551 domain-containing protein [Escherichia coli]|nr:DUF551 domain-containing protein [Escherichia coli]